MDTTAVSRIRQSIDLLAPQADLMMSTFYDRLFAAFPPVRAMFPKDMTQQKKHLIAAVALVVKHADNLPAIEKPLLDMGARHAGYGAKPEHYGLVRDTLLGTMKDLAGPAWTPQHQEDWTAAINAVAGIMIRGAEQAARSAA